MKEKPNGGRHNLLLEIVKFLNIGWITQKYLRHTLKDRIVKKLMLFDYNNGAFDVLVEGECDKRNRQWADSFVDEMITFRGERNRILIYTDILDSNCGLMLVLTSSMKHHTRLFQAGIFSPEQCMLEISEWCRKEWEWISSQGSQAQ